MISPGFPDFVESSTCAKQETFLAEATRGHCTLDLEQSWLGVLRPQQQLPEEAPEFLELTGKGRKERLVCAYGGVATTGSVLTGLTYELLSQLGLDEPSFFSILP